MFSFWVGVGQDGIMAEDASEAEEMREQWLSFDYVAEVPVLDEPVWVRP
jgi:hypothetical protein